MDKGPKNGYFRGDMTKFVIGWLEKFSVGSLLIGFYQDSAYAVCLGMIAAFVAMRMLQEEK
jgi:hypothetical protein